MTASPKPKALRCAIYTRKSSEEGLQQDFNSLDAQREACAAYILSQAGEGWIALPDIYDDGGFSGGSMERPALQQLLKDAAAGRIDVVVVYKVDRLTRSLSDFARIVDVFDGVGASFVSVTQAFNTTTSMGRLTLNVLLSFAQFEREVTGERIRDKIAASKAKGMWMGGNVPLGYEAEGRTLKIDPADADTVRHIYRRYLELASVHRLRDELEAQGCLSKRRLSQAGKARGGTPFGRGALFHLLSNRAYLGEVPHKGRFYPGQHPAIIDAVLFDAVQCALAENAGPVRRARVGLLPLAPAAPLSGLVHDDQGNLMSPVTAKGRRGQSYRYYVSSAVQLGRPDKAGTVKRIPAADLEQLVLAKVRSIGWVIAEVDPWGDVRDMIVRVEVEARRIRIVFRHGAIADDAEHSVMAAGDELTREGQHTIMTVRATVKSRGGSRLIVGPLGQPAVATTIRDPALIKALARAEAWRRQLLEGREPSLTAIGKKEGLADAYVQRVIRLAFLGPGLKRAILDGRQPTNLILNRFMHQDLPLDWELQRRQFA